MEGWERPYQAGQPDLSLPSTIHDSAHLPWPFISFSFTHRVRSMILKSQCHTVWQSEKKRVSIIIYDEFDCCQYRCGLKRRGPCHVSWRGEGNVALCPSLSPPQYMTVSHCKAWGQSHSKSALPGIIQNKYWYNNNYISVVSATELCGKRSPGAQIQLNRYGTGSFTL